MPFCVLGVDLWHEFDNIHTSKRNTEQTSEKELKMFDRDVAKAAVTKMFNAKIREAINLWGFNREFMMAELSFRTFGTAAGKCEINYRPYDRHMNKCIIRINIGMMVASQEAWDHVLNETVSHEIAHLADFLLGNGEGHTESWEQCHKLLGGSAKTHHTLKVVTKPRRPNRVYVYSVNGGFVKLTSKQHEAAKAGARFTARVNGKTTVFGIQEFLMVE